jgi:hypothetical protein
MLLAWFREQIIELNCFGHEDDGQPEEGDVSSQNALTLREQRLATRFYIVLLYSKLFSIGKFSRLRRNARARCISQADSWYNFEAESFESSVYSISN